MILTALKELAERDGLVDDPDYEPKEVHYLLHISRDGRITGFTSTLSPPASGKGKPRPVKKRVPRHCEPTSNDKADFLTGKPEYVFGIDPDGSRPEARVRSRHELFLKEVERCVAGTNGDEAVRALFEALVSYSGDPPMPAEITRGSLFAFVYEPDSDLLISERPSVRAFWRETRHPANAERVRNSDFTCLITGTPCLPSDKHPRIRRVPGITSGAALVSFNKDAFESYGLRRNDNAPVSQAAAEAYTTALNRLLDPAYPSPVDGTPLPRRNVRLNGSTVVVFWSRESSEFVDLFADIEANPAAVLAAIEAPYTGRKPVLEDPQAFYAAILSGAQGRAILRQWIEATVASVAANVRQHFDDLTIVRPHGETRPQPLWVLLPRWRCRVSRRIFRPD